MVIERLHQWVRLMLQGAVCAIALMMLAPPATAQSQFNGAGDLNDDDTIDMEDVRLMMQIIKGEIALDNLTLELADIAPVDDRDSEVNANDLEVLMRAVGNDDFDGDGRDNDDELTDGLGENPFLADTDGDGLTDGEEFNHLPSRTDPTNPDSDGDGLLDGFEESNGTNPSLADSSIPPNGLTDYFEYTYPLASDPNGHSDTDGLTNLEEQAAGSNPFLNDTDGDGLDDKVEVDGSAHIPPIGPYPSDPADTDTDDDGLDDLAESLHGTRPHQADPDLDGLTDTQEVLVLLTNPFDSDSDDDGLLDGFEDIYGLDPNDTDSDDDRILDGDEDEDEEIGDGLNNLGEQLAGSSPLVRDSDGDTILDGAEITGGTSPASTDSDEDGFSDTADNCPKNFNPGQEDDDDGFEVGDGVGDVCDNCIYADNKFQEDADGDGFGDACDTTCLGTQTGPDPDRDGWCGSDDNCPNWPNPGQADNGGIAGVGDACECGDINNDNWFPADPADKSTPTTANNDILAYAAYMDSSEPIHVDALHKCDLDGDGMCTAGDQALAQYAVNNTLPLSPGLCADYDQVLDHVVSRTGYGANAHSRRLVREIGVTAYIDRQLDPDSINDATIGNLLDQYRSGGTFWPTLGPAPTAVPGRPAPADPVSIQNSNYFRRAYGIDTRRPLHDLSEIKMWRAIHSKRQLEAVMRDLMFDHLSVNGFSGFSRWPFYSIMQYEAAIEEHLFGKFEHMVQASAESAAMLDYLDQHRSAAGKINENYGREVMELHTVGDGTYDNNTVIAASNVLTGYMLNIDARWLPLGGPEQDDWVFEYNGAKHESADKIVTIDDNVTPIVPWVFTGPNGGPPCGSGNSNQGELLICLLSEHPATAKRIAELFVTRFVSEDLETAAVATLVSTAAAEYVSTSGDLGATLRVVLHDPLFVKGAYYRAKVKRPFAFMASLFRALGEGAEGGSETRFAGHEHGVPSQSNKSFRSLGIYFSLLDESPYQAVPPIGYQDDSKVFASSGGILVRSNFVKQVMVNWDADWVSKWEFLPTELDDNAVLLDKLIDRFLPGGIRRTSVVAGQSTRDYVLASLDAEWPAPSATNANLRIEHATSVLLSTPEFLLH